ncbi:partner of Y14 and mago [Drosophila rhopaloa]|uniref:Partner of Y14 and mago n=1 Tax=Drosophila rhopaloa TaxID=1041015 RepID=A0A6P4E7I2_DRORH|nr:partner of Y14 and mago [Drosophila rhopaloa]
MSTYLQSSEGKFIPATKRPDGTWRKARRVKDGYVPQEEVPLYESKGKQFVAQRSQAGVPPGMCPLVAAESKKEREKQERTKAKKQDKDAARQPKAPTPGVLVVSPPSTCPPPKVNQQPSGSREINSLSRALEDTLKLDGSQEVDPAKQLKKLRKKVREIEQIESRIQAGEQKKLDKDQLDKVKKKSEILRQIKALESEPRS